MRTLIALSAFTLAACATPASAGEPDATYTSAKAPAEIAACIADAMRVRPKIKPLDGGGLQVARKNNFGMVMVRWDIRPTATGSTVEFNDRLGVNSGREKAERCF